MADRLTDRPTNNPFNIHREVTRRIKSQANAEANKKTEKFEHLINICNMHIGHSHYEILTRLPIILSRSVVITYIRIFRAKYRVHTYIYKYTYINISYNAVFLQLASKNLYSSNLPPEREFGTYICICLSLLPIQCF